MSIEARKLFKKHEDRIAVNNVYLNIKSAECFGILGPDLSGKSSLLKMMYCAARPTSGELYVLGLNVLNNPLKIKAQIGIVPEDYGLDYDFNVLNNLLVFASYYGLNPSRSLMKARELLRTMSLENLEEESIANLSVGYRQRLAMARALINDPKILFLDEPTKGLEPPDRQAIWNMINDFKAKGHTVVICTKYMDEVEKVCDRLVVLDHGQILAEGRSKDLIHEHIGEEVIEFDIQQSDLNYYINKMNNEYKYQVLNNKIRLFMQEGQSAKSALDVISSDTVVIRKPSIHDVFIKLAGYELRS